MARLNVEEKLKKMNETSQRPKIPLIQFRHMIDFLNERSEF
jgi:hypothetical protein